MNTCPIDIVVPWVNSNDKEWQFSCNYWKQKITGESNQQRFRDAGTFHFWFRCIEKNCPWFRYVVLILASPSQIPNWLNTRHPRLRIVYHKDFIPETELPTFNSSVINCHIPFIEGLSENYILFNDDMFVTKPMKPNDWFIHGIPVQWNLHESYRRNGSWSENIINSKELVSNVTNVICDSNPEHGPIANIRSLNIFLWHKQQYNIISALSNSKFRCAKNVTDWMFFFFATSLGYYELRPHSIVDYRGTEDCSISSCPISCFNDTLLIKDYELYKHNMKQCLTTVVSHKSSFER